MINIPSASKRRSSSRSLYCDEPYTERAVTYREPLLDQGYGYAGESRRMGASRKSSCGRAQRFQDQEKQNINYIQSRLDKYDSKTPICSPLKQPLYSPMKQSNNNYEPFTSRLSVNLVAPKNQFSEEGQYTERLVMREGSKRKQDKYISYNPNRNIYKPKLSQKNPICYEIQYQNQQESANIELKRVPLSARASKRQPNSLGITFSNNIGSAPSGNTTPKKTNVPIGDELVEKCQFLKQRLDKLSRMTPKGASRRNEQIQDITPEKIIFKDPREVREIRDIRDAREVRQSRENREFRETRQSKELRDSREVKQLQNSNIVKHNKYCDEKLPLQTIYDSEQHRQGYREVTQEGQDGLQQINSLSRKISDRLSKIISRHS